MEYQTTALTEHGIGAEIRGVDLSQPVADADRRLHRIMIKGSVLSDELPAEAERSAVRAQRILA